MTTITNNIYQIYLSPQIEEDKKVVGRESSGPDIFQPKKTTTESDLIVSNIQQLIQLLPIVKKTKVLNYLVRYPEIVPFIMNASKEISTKLKEDTKIILDFDEETAPGYPLLVVRQKTYQEDFLDIILEIGYKFIDLTQSLQGKFRIITDYKSF